MEKIFSSSPRNSHLIILTQAILGVIAFFYFILSGQNIYILYSFIGSLFLINVGHHAGLHRYFSHNSYKTSNFWHIFLCFFSCLVSSGSPLAYTVAHRTHHLYSDTEKDPHGSHIGFLNVMLYKWNLKDVPIRVLKNQNEKWIKFTNRYYALIIISFFMSLFMIDFRYALMYSLSVLVVMIGNAWVNYGNHLKNNPLNYRNFETKDDSHNDLIGGYLFGEWHNNHHKYPSRYNERIKWWEFDLAAQFIKLIKK